MRIPLVCTRCHCRELVLDEPVKGMPVLEWWESKGRICKDCLRKAAVGPGPVIGPDFDGAVYDRASDHSRLTGQILDVYEAMKDGQWRTVAEIEQLTGHPETSISAQLRNLRKKRFGAYAVDTRRRSGSLWEYRVGQKGTHAPQHSLTVVRAQERAQCAEARAQQLVEALAQYEPHHPLLSG